MNSKRIIAVCMAILLLSVIAIPVIAQEPAPARMLLKYDEPAWRTAGDSQPDVWKSASLPIGNGKIGATILGEPNNDSININEETLWSGGRGDKYPNYDGGNPDPASAKAAYENISNKLLNGQGVSDKEMEALRGDSENDGGYDNGYLPLGSLNISNIGHDGYSNYERTLDLDNGVATVDYNKDGVHYSREFFVSNPDNVMVGKYSSNHNGKISFNVAFSNSSALNSSTSSNVQDNVGYISATGTVKSNGLMHSTHIAVVPTNGTVTANGGSLSVTNADSVTIYLTTATDYKNKFSNDDKTIDYYYRTGESADALNNRVKSVLDKALNKGYESVRSTHISDYTNLYNRVNLDLGQSEPNLATNDLLNAYKNNSASKSQKRYLEVLVFQYGRYLLIAGSREDSQIPTNLQGIWNDTTTPRWGSDIHTNINLQMNYWLSGNCNLTECALPLVNYMSLLKEPGGRTVEIYTGSQYGIMAHTQNTPFGYTAPGWNIGTWGWSPAAATWLMQNCYDYYQFSQDTDTLRNTIYPMLKEQVLMYEELLKEKDGRMVMPIALSPELELVTAGNTFEQSIIAQLYKDTIEAAKILGVDENELVKWQATYEKLKPIEIGSSGQIKEWYHEDAINSVIDTSAHRHLSNLLGLFPGDIVDTPEKIAAARVSLDNKNFGAVGKTRNNPEGGWTYGQMIPSWARVGDGDNAYFCVSQLISNRLYNNLWDYHTPSTFQIDGNYGYSAGVAEMLVQSHLGYIDFIPAISSEWSDGKVEGLLAEGNFEIGIEWKNSQVKEATIKAKYAGECSFKSPFKGKTVRVVDSKGNNVELTEQTRGIYTFNAKANETYTVKTPPELNLKIARDESGKVRLTWDAQPGVEYKIYREELYF